ncbi:MAG: outer membrane beta-barrel protein [Burkholderiales bacterium]|nr:outer membrane beta-barrel protein [Burkholderiales bacterium]
MKKLVVTVAVCTFLSGVALAEQGPWMVRARAVGLDMANKDGTGLGLSVNNKTIPEIDVSYFFNKNVAVELILTVPQKQTVNSVALTRDIGTFKHLPPVLTLQYHFDTGSGIKPYVGAGLNYTQITKVNLLDGGANINSHSWGTALQAGVDFPIDKNLSFNIDFKKINLKTDVFVGTDNKGVLKLDPTLIGMGLGYRF